MAPCGCLKRTKPPPPPKLPAKTTGNYRLDLQNVLLNHYKSSTFNICPHQPLPQMTGPPMHLMIDPDAQPVAYHSPYKVPLHFQDQVKAGLEMDVSLGVIAPVPSNVPTKWCHRMVVCAKKDGTPRRTVDFQALNKHASRETHHTQSPFHLARSVPHNMKKTTCDAWNGYHGVPITDASRPLTTFITQWGRFWYLVAPQGYIASGDGYTKRYDAITSDVNNMVRCIDDTLLWAPNIEQSFYETVQYLELCGNNGIILNPAKFNFAANEVEFAGFEITMTNVRPCDSFLRGILNFPTPKSITDIRSWFGLVNQASYAFSMADKMLPFRALLKPGSKFEWTPALEKAFQLSKLAIASDIKQGVRIFDKSRPTCLATDWSKSGIGFWLFQKHCDCQISKLFCCSTGWKITLAGSRFTHAAESRYAPVEGEALAVVYALDKARYFVLGCQNLTIAVDHKPLLKLFGDRSLQDIPNPRLRNLKEKTLRYRFNMVHISGVKQLVADGLSRHPVDRAEILELPDDIASLGLSPHQQDTIHQQDPHANIEDCTIATALCSFNASPITAATWDLVRTATTSDETMQKLSDLIEFGFPESKSNLPEAIKPYFQLKDDLSSVDGVILYGDRLLIPTSLRQNVLSTLHSAHQGTDRMLARADSSVFWPGITKDIKDIRNGCAHCNRNAPSNPSAPPTPPIQPAYPFQCICADYFTLGEVTYLVIVDRYSNWPIVHQATGGAAGLITALKSAFVTYGIPEELASDGGPEFTASITVQFLKNWGVHHRLSSVAFAHSNCRAELGVKSMKRLMEGNTGHGGSLNNDTFLRALLQYRNTPDTDTKLSPAMCLFGRQIRDFIPVLPGKYEPHESWRKALDAREEALRHRHMKAHERLSEHTKRLPVLRIGDNVRVQNQTGNFPLKWDKTGIIIEVRQFDQYLVKIDGSGRITLWNRKCLRKYLPVQPTVPTRLIADDMNTDNQPLPDVTDQPTTPTERATDPCTTSNPRRSSRPSRPPPSLDDYVTPRQLAAPRR